VENTRLAQVSWTSLFIINDYFKSILRKYFYSPVVGVSGHAKDPIAACWDAAQPRGQNDRFQLSKEADLLFHPPDKVF